MTALVTAINANGTVDVWIIGTSMSNGYTRSGVKHVTDPSIKEWERSEVGGWDYTTWDQILMQWMDRQRFLDEKSNKLILKELEAEKRARAAARPTPDELVNEAAESAPAEVVVEGAGAAI